MEPAVLREALAAPVALADADASTELDPDAGSWFVCGTPPLLLIAAGSGDVHVAEPELSWRGPSQLLLSARNTVSHAATPVDDMVAWLGPVARELVASRRRRFRTCAKCGDRIPSEWMHDRRICQRCVQRHGVVY